MQSTSSTQSSRQLAATPTMESAFSSSSARGGNGHGGGNGTPPSFPKFNLPDSYWSRTRDQESIERLTQHLSVTDVATRRLAASSQTQNIMFKALVENHAERESDRLSLIASTLLEVKLMPIQAADFRLSAKSQADLLVLMGPGGAKPQSLSGTSAASTATTTSAATAVQQDTAASGCCIPPACTIL